MNFPRWKQWRQMEEWSHSCSHS